VWDERAKQGSEGKDPGATDTRIDCEKLIWQRLNK